MPVHVRAAVAAPESGRPARTAPVRAVRAMHGPGCSVHGCRPAHPHPSGARHENAPFESEMPTPQAVRQHVDRRLAATDARIDRSGGPAGHHGSCAPARHGCFPSGGRGHHGGAPRDAEENRLGLRVSSLRAAGLRADGRRRRSSRGSDGEQPRPGDDTDRKRIKERLKDALEQHGAGQQEEGTAEWLLGICEPDLHSGKAGSRCAQASGAGWVSVRTGRGPAFRRAA